MHRVARLTQQHSITFNRAGHARPVFSFRVVAEGGQHGAQIVGVDRDFGQIATELLALNREEQAPTVKRIRSTRTGMPGPTDVLGRPMG